MKKLVSLGLVLGVLVFSGCDFSKQEAIYGVGKDIIVINADLIPDDMMEKLKKIDEAAKRVKAANDVVEDAKKEETIDEVDNK